MVSMISLAKLRSILAFTTAILAISYVPSLQVPGLQVPSLLAVAAAAQSRAPSVQTTENQTAESQTTESQTTESREPVRQPSRQSNPRRANPTTKRPRPPRRLPPNRVQPGGGLDDAVQACDPNSSPLTALVPVSNPVYTATAHPTFLFHIPDPPAAIAYAEFILLSSDEKEEIYSTRFLPRQAGIVSISIPAKADYALQVGEAYHWYLNLHCQSTTGVPSVNGWVQRIAETDVAESAATESAATESAVIETSRTATPADTDIPEIWYDVIAQTAAEIAIEGSPDSQARASWQRWLSAIGLDDIANVPPAGIQLDDAQPL